MGKTELSGKDVGGDGRVGEVETEDVVEDDEGDFGTGGGRGGGGGGGGGRGLVVFDRVGGGRGMEGTFGLTGESEVIVHR